MAPWLRPAGHTSGTSCDVHTDVIPKASATPSLLPLLAGLALVAGCTPAPAPVRGDPSAAAASAPPTASPSHYASVRIDGVPHVAQKPDFCGEAVAAAYLTKLGQPYDQDVVFALSGMDPARGMGATTRELKTALERIGFDVGPVWQPVRAADADVEIEQLFAAMHADLQAGVPSIVCMHYSDRPRTTEHFRLVLGYDAQSGEVLYHEPAEADGAYRRMDRALFLKLWPLKYDRERWTAIRFRLSPGELRAPPAPSTGHSPADYAQHVIALRQKLPQGFTVVVEPPFVVVGDDPPEVVRRRAAATVRWSVDKLKAAYFQRDPEQILDVWLFKDDASYRKHTRLLFDDTPSTPYGYYSPDHDALIMNIATGGGTLVHEIVHPFVEANFPSCPAWFNEGLGSLYEQSAERDGKIVGLTNWRLAGLQRAIRKGRVPSFRELTATSKGEFYDEDPGSNYAQARYLLYYLQERDLLGRYYRQFRATHKTDPGGYQALVEVLGEDDMAAFQKRWERYVLSLSFP